jgi:hypothetical protein
MKAATAQEIREWAQGSHPVEAATELLLRAFGGRFAEPGLPWVRQDHRRAWVDFDAITDDATGVYSGGERRLLAIVASLGGNQPVNLNEALPGLDRTAVALVLAAVAQAAGSHQHSDIHIDPETGSVDIVELDTLYPWPSDRQGLDAG